MIQLAVQFVAKGESANLTPEQAGVHVNDGAATVLVIDGGMSSGRPSVAINLQMPEGGGMTFETSAALFLSAVRIIAARYPNL